MLISQRRVLRLREVKQQPKVWGRSQSRIQRQVGSLTTSCLAGGGGAGGGRWSRVSPFTPGPNSKVLVTPFPYPAPTHLAEELSLQRNL